MPKKSSSSETSLSLSLSLFVCVVPFVQINFTVTKRVKREKKNFKSKIHIILVCRWCTNMTICTHAKKNGKQRQPNTKKKKQTHIGYYMSVSLCTRSFNNLLFEEEEEEKIKFLHSCFQSAQIHIRIDESEEIEFWKQKIAPKHRIL